MRDQAIGRIEGAIAHHAEEVFASLTDEEKRRAEGLFLRLVRPGEAGGVTRRTAKLDEFDAVDGAHSAASKCHRVVCVELHHLRGAVHERG
jgi:hypothetical protein